MTGIVMPNGVRYRISSVRRYIVVSYNGVLDKWQAVYRTDDHGRALARWRQECRSGGQTSVIDAKYSDGPAVIR